MVVLYIVLGLIVAGSVTLIFFRQKSVRAGKKELRRRTEKIEEERIERADKAEARGRAKKIEEKRSKESGPIGGLRMDKFDVGARVRIKETFPKHPGEEGIIIRLGVGTVAAVTELIKVPQVWLVQVGDEYEEIPERDLELISG